MSKRKAATSSADAAAPPKKAPSKPQFLESWLDVSNSEGAPWSAWLKPVPDPADRTYLVASCVCCRKTSKNRKDTLKDHSNLPAHAAALNKYKQQPSALQAMQKGVTAQHKVGGIYGCRLRLFT